MDQGEQREKLLSRHPEIYLPLLCSLDEASFMLDLDPAYGWGSRAVIHQSAKRTVTYALICDRHMMCLSNWSTELEPEKQYYYSTVQCCDQQAKLCA